MNRSAYPYAYHPPSTGAGSNDTQPPTHNKSQQQQYPNKHNVNGSYQHEPSISLCSTTVGASLLSTRTTSLYNDDPYSRITLNDDDIDVHDYEYQHDDSDNDNDDIDLDSDFDARMSMDDDDDTDTIQIDGSAEPFYHRLPPELLDQILLFLTPHDMSTSLTHVNRYMHEYIESRDELWHQHLIQLSINQRWDLYMTDMPSSIIPSINSLHQWHQRTYADLYRVLCHYGAFFGHWYSSSNTINHGTGAMLDVSYSSHDNHIYMTQVDVSRPHERSRTIGTINLLAHNPVTGQRWIPPVQLYWNANVDGHSRHQPPSVPCTRQQTRVGTIEFTPFDSKSALVKRHMPHTISGYGDALSSNIVNSWTGQSIDYNHVTVSSNKQPLMTWNRIPLTPLSKQAMMSNSLTCSINNVQCNRHVPWRQQLHDQHASDASHWTRQGFPEPGLYYGDYGPHGQELLYVFYQGYELIAMKIVGDHNVASGKISFRIDCRTDQEREEQLERDEQLLGSDYDSNDMATAQQPQQHSTAPVTALHANNMRVDGDINREVNMEIVLAAAGHDELDDEDADADMDAGFVPGRHMMPVTPPLFPVTNSRPGQGCIAFSGYRQPRLIPVVAHFHDKSVFSLEFFGLILFKPFHCLCHRRMAAHTQQHPNPQPHVHRHTQQQQTIQPTRAQHTHTNTRTQQARPQQQQYQYQQAPRPVLFL